MDLNDDKLRGSLGAKFEAFERELPPLMIGRLQAELARAQAEKRAAMLKRGLWSLTVLVLLFGTWWLFKGSDWSLFSGTTEPTAQLTEGGNSAPVSGIDFTKEPLTDGMVDKTEAEPTYKPEVTAQLNQDVPASPTEQLSAPRSGEATVPEAAPIKTPEIKSGNVKSASPASPIAVVTSPEKPKETIKADAEAVEPKPAAPVAAPKVKKSVELPVVKAEPAPTKRVVEPAVPVATPKVKKSVEVPVVKAEPAPTKRVVEPAAPVATPKVRKSVELPVVKAESAEPEVVTAPVVRRKKVRQSADRASADVLAMVERPKRTRKAMPEPVLDEVVPEANQLVKPAAARPAMAEKSEVKPAEPVVEQPVATPAPAPAPKPAPVVVSQQPASAPEKQGPPSQPDRVAQLASRNVKAPRTGRLKGNTDLAKQVLAAQAATKSADEAVVEPNQLQLQQDKPQLPSVLTLDSAGYVKPVTAAVQAKNQPEPLVATPAEATQQLDKPSADVLSKSGSRTSYGVRASVYNTRYTVLANPTGEQQVTAMQSSTGLVSRLAADLMAVHQYQLTNSLQLQTGLGLMYAQNSNDIRYTDGQISGYAVNNGTYSALMVENQLAFTQRRLMAQLAVNLSFKPFGKTSNFYLTGGLQGYVNLMRQELVTLNGLVADATMVESKFGRNDEAPLQTGFSLGFGYRFALPANMVLDLEPTYKTLFGQQHFGSRFVTTSPEWIGIGAKVTF